MKQISRKLALLFCFFWVSLSLFGQAETAAQIEEINKVEIKLIDPLDDERGWCVDLFAHLTRALPLGGFQGHDCFLFMGNGPTQDQGFDASRFKRTGELQLVYYDVCLTMHDPNPSSFVAAEQCSGGPAQKFEMTEQGQIKSVSTPSLCLTLGKTSVPGGGRLAPVGARPPASNKGIPQIRRLTFELCDESIAKLQSWMFRSGEYTPEEPTEPHRFFEG